VSVVPNIRILFIHARHVTKNVVRETEVILVLVATEAKRETEVIPVLAETKAVKATKGVKEIRETKVK
jgi:hypothetical protein